MGHLTRARRALFGAAVLGAMGFGVSQAFAGTAPPRPNCPAYGFPYDNGICNIGCPNGGYCSAAGECICGSLP